MSATRSSSAPYCPDAGDVVWINFDPTVGHEIAKRRPALVLSPRAYNAKAELCVAVAMTSRRRGYRFEVDLDDGGVALADQVRSLSWEERRPELIRRAPGAVVADVRAKLKTLLGIV